MKEKILKPDFKETLKFWLKLGFVSFGGPAGQIAIMYEYVVEKKKWVSESKFLHSLNYCMLLPGPEAQQLATYIGWLLHNIRGGLAAGLLFVLPSVFILLILSVLYVLFGKIPVVYSLFDGLKPAVAAIVLAALIKMAKKSLNNLQTCITAGLSFILIFFFKVSFPYIIIFTIILSLLIIHFVPEYSGDKIVKESERDNENKYVINKFTITHSKLTIRSLVFKSLIFVLLWATPLILLVAMSDGSGFWSELVMFFTKSAFVTFGGAYSVLTYTAQAAVENYSWLSKFQMIDGLALGETTPGPLIMVLSFVGFMAGYNSFDSSISSGILGLIITTYYIFLPSFFFIFAGAPFIEMTQHNEKIKSVLSYVSAAVVGVILNLTVYIATAVIFHDVISISNLNIFVVVWLGISFVALQFYKVNIIKWIGVSALAGIVKYLMQSFQML